MQQRNGEKERGNVSVGAGQRGQGTQGSLAEKVADEQGPGRDEGGRLCVSGETVIQEEEPAGAKALR